MTRRAVVPERDAVGLPAEPAGERRVGDVLVEHREEVVPLAAGELDDVAREVRVHEQCLLARLGVHAHHGVHRTEVLRLELLLERARQLAACERKVVVVHGVQLVAQSLERFGQPLVGDDEVRPLRVTAVRRDDDAAQDRSHRRVRARR